MCGRLTTVGTHLMFNKNNNDDDDNNNNKIHKRLLVSTSAGNPQELLWSSYLCTLIAPLFDWERLITMGSLWYWGMEVMYWSCLLNYKGKQQSLARSYFHETPKHPYFHWGITHTHIQSHTAGHIGAYSLRMMIFPFWCWVMGTEQLCSLNSHLLVLVFSLRKDHLSKERTMPKNTSNDISPHTKIYIPSYIYSP